MRDFYEMFPPIEVPYGWAQWKGTDVCLDFHCECGFDGHFDGDFAYYLKCPECGAVYALDGHIRFVRLTREEEIAAAPGVYEVPKE